jgi:S1-C subfamily serine protease
MILCLLVVPVSGLYGQGRDSASMMNLVSPVAQTVGDSVVQVLSGGTPVVLGTVVGADGYLLTKRSELSNDPIRVRLADGRLFPARVAAVRRENDLALLRIESEVDISLQPVTFVGETPPVASFLISAGRAGRAIGIGVVGAPQRSIEHQGRLGVVLQNDAEGRALVQAVWRQSGAELAGIEPGDLIIAINGRMENSRLGVINTLRGMFPGESVRLTILRPNDSMKMETLEMDAGIRDFGMMQESENDSMVNGRRNIRLSGFDRVIQHDTVLDPDECGGPVLNIAGQVVGLNIARAGRVVSYALPASLVIPEMVSMLEEARSAN